MFWRVAGPIATATNPGSARYVCLPATKFPVSQVSLAAPDDEGIWWARRGGELALVALLGQQQCWCPFPLDLRSLVDLGS